MSQKMEGKHTFESSLEVNAPVEKLFNWHESPGAFERLTPSFDPVTVTKRLGNGIDPFEIIKKYSADATRWYMISNAQPWDNLRFDEQGKVEVQKKFFSTLYNAYSFFALYANIDRFKSREKEISISNKPELDRWIISELNSE